MAFETFIVRVDRRTTRPHDPETDQIAFTSLKVGGASGTEISSATVVTTPADIVTAPATPKPGSSSEHVAEQQPAESVSNAVEIKSPMVGTFYRAPSPEADPYIKEGDTVSPGKVLCIIEAMKLMNEIEAEISGRIVKILVENTQAVEYNQPLFLVEPS